MIVFISSRRIFLFSRSFSDLNVSKRGSISAFFASLRALIFCFWSSVRPLHDFTSSLAFSRESLFSFIFSLFASIFFCFSSCNLFNSSLSFFACSLFNAHEKEGFIFAFSQRDSLYFFCSSNFCSFSFFNFSNSSCVFFNSACMLLTSSFGEQSAHLYKVPSG